MKTVYWSAFVPTIQDFPSFRFEEPYSVLKDKTKHYLESVKKTDNLADRNNFMMCPSVRDQLKNIYSIRSPIDISINIGDNITTDMDINFINRIFSVRNNNIKLYSLQMYYFLICEESLDIEVSSCYFSNNDFCHNNIIVPGTFDIGKWVRPLEITFINKNKDIRIKENDELLYVKFNEGVNFKRFFLSANILEYMNQFMYSKNYKKPAFYPLTYYYDMYKKTKMKNMLIKQIKHNLMEN